MMFNSGNIAASQCKADTVSVSTSTSELYGMSSSTVDDILQKLSSTACIKSVNYRIPFQLNDMSPGDVFKLKLNGDIVEFTVMQKNYESELNGSNKVLVMKKELEPEHIYDSDSEYYPDSEIDVYLNNTWINYLDDDIKNLINTSTFYYHRYHTSSAYTVSRKIFLLSGAEFGITNSDMYVDGSKVDGADSWWDNYFVPEQWGTPSWTRSISKSGGSRVYLVYNEGDSYKGVIDYRCSLSFGFNPAFTLPGNVTLYRDENCVVYTSQLTDISLTDVLGNVFTAWPRVEVGSYVGTGLYGSENPTKLSFDENPDIIILGNGIGTGAFGSTPPLVVLWGITTSLGESSGSSWTNTISYSENTISWYGQAANAQYNSSGKTYYYITIYFQ